MKRLLSLNSSDKWLLEKAYLMKPEGSINLSTLGMFDQDIDAHDAFEFTAFQRLTKLGYVICEEDTTWTIGKRHVDVVIFRLTPLGITQAEKLVSDRRAYSVREHLSEFTRSDWIALIALLVAVFALFQVAS